MNKLNIYLALILIVGLSSLAWAGAGTDPNSVHQKVILPENVDTHNQPTIKPHFENGRPTIEEQQIPPSFSFDDIGRGRILLPDGWSAEIYVVTHGNDTPVFNMGAVSDETGKPVATYKCNPRTGRFEIVKPDKSAE